MQLKNNISYQTPRINLSQVYLNIHNNTQNHTKAYREAHCFGFRFFIVFFCNRKFFLDKLRSYLFLLHLWSFYEWYESFC